MPTLSPARIYALARGTSLSHDQAIIATAIALAESGGRTDAVGDTSLTDATWGPSIGLWQIRSLKAEEGTGRSRDGSKLRDPAYNARSMWAISGGGMTWQPWSVYTSGAYRSHLGAVREAVGAGGVDAPRARSVGWVDDLGETAGGLAGGAVPDPEGMGRWAGEVAGEFTLPGIRDLVVTGALVAGGLAVILVGAGAVLSGKGAAS